ncbi:MAG: MerR family transcriptional regulator [Sandaracinus sp.]|nr:MerR family transcriptional regulator [Sandaracinus sp.]
MSDRGEYRIGTVSKLTGVDPHTIRAWERRYQAIVPRRTDGGTRLYGDADVHRLRLLKAVTDAGDAIGVVANLADVDLRSRLSALAGASEPERSAPSPSAGSIRVAVLGSQLADRLRTAEELEVVHDAGAIDGLLDVDDVHALVLHLPAMGPAPAIALERLRGATGTHTAVVLYEFATRRTLAELARRGAALLRGPMAPSELASAVADLLTLARVPRRPSAAPVVDDEPPERLFDDAQLVRLRDIASSVQCECPNHLATIVESLVAFEAYSRRCESVDAEDADLHGRLARGTGRARAVVEALLVDLMEYDDLSF